MKVADVEALVSDVPPGTVLRLTFKDEAAVFAELPYLQGLVRAEKITMELVDFIMLLAVAQSRDWGALKETRELTVRTTATFDVEWFVDRMSRPLERLEVLFPS